MSKSNKHAVEFGREIFKRESETRVYSHVVCGYSRPTDNACSIYAQHRRPLALSWSSSEALALKQLAKWSKWYDDVVVLPVSQFTPRSAPKCVTLEGGPASDCPFCGHADCRTRTQFECARPVAS